MRPNIARCVELRAALRPSPTIEKLEKSLQSSAPLLGMGVIGQPQADGRFLRTAFTGITAQPPPLC